MNYKKPIREINKVFIHCSATDKPEHDDISVIRDWHVAGNGWSDVGYHYYIRKDGVIQKGRPLERVPAAQRGHNTYSIAICLHGLNEFSVKQFDKLKALCEKIAISHCCKVTFHGHCEVSNKSCPVFDYKSVLNLNDDGVMNGS